MSGHSKWSTIKRKKGELDAKKGKIFTKLVKEITTSARLGGGDAGANPRLRAAIAGAKAQSMPQDNIERAIKKGTGALDGPAMEDQLYEGYAPGGVAVLVEAQTDNKNRTVSEVRAAFAKAGGSMAAAGAVAYLFKKRAQLLFQKTPDITEESLLPIALDAGADDVADLGEHILIDADPKAFGTLLDHTEQHHLTPTTAELTWVPDATVPLDAAAATKVQALLEKLEDLDDVQNVFANAAFP